MRSSGAFFFSIAALALATSALQAQPQNATPASKIDCAAALLPQIDMENRSSAMASAWLKLVDEKTFEVLNDKVTTNTGASAGLPIDGIPAQFSGFFDGDWETFQQKRRDFFSLEQTAQSEAAAEAIVRQSLTDQQLQTYNTCVQAVLKSVEHGAFLTLVNDSVEGVAVTLTYKGMPGSKLRFDMTVDNGAVDGDTRFSRKLSDGASYSFVVKRSKPPASITIVANSSAYSAVAASIWPPPARAVKLTFGEILMSA